MSTKCRVTLVSMDFCCIQEESWIAERPPFGRGVGTVLRPLRGVYLGNERKGRDVSLRPGPRPEVLLGVLLVGVLFVAAVSAGCLGPGPTNGSSGPSGGEDHGDSPENEHGPSDQDDLPRRIPEQATSGVQTLADMILHNGGAVGHVFDEHTRELIEGASVVAQCHVPGLEVPLGADIAETDQDGRFAFPAGPPLSACKEVTYTVVMEGYTQAQSLSSDPLEPGTQHFVLIGMSPE